MNEIILNYKRYSKRLFLYFIDELYLIFIQFKSVFKRIRQYFYGKKLHNSSFFSFEKYSLGKNEKTFL